MLRYTLAAFALKAFSSNGAGRKLYRQLGNRIGGRQRLAVSDIDIRVARGDLLVELCRKHGVVRDGDRVLEIGTGWMHWYSLYLRLFYDLEITALDIWDNRQFDALKAAAAKLADVFAKRDTEPRARAAVQTVLACRTFAELYERLGYRYVIEPTGSIAQFPHAAFDMIMSFHVLEHVPTQYVEALVANMHRTLRPGGHLVHQIGIDDHLTHYDVSASPKQYLKYSDATWRLLFENEVQYFNRLQGSEWKAVFERHGFRLIDEIAENADIASLRIHPRFAQYARDDLACTTLTLVYRKPS
jgi:SAM-dependent methyltransferase